jgi:hypothetical protein
MNKLTIKHGNGNETRYQLINDGQNLPIAYHEQTGEELIKVLEMVRKNRIRVKIYLGDIKTGKDWCEEHDTIGYIGLSKGTQARYPILIYNERSYGGGALLDHCIVKIKESKGGKILYQAKNYKQPEIEIVNSDLTEYSHNTIVNGILYGRHKTYKSATNLKAKLS